MTLHPAFHLSLGVKSIEDSINFFVTVLEAKVTHRDPSGYVNLDLFGNQITLKMKPSVYPDMPDFHFGVNLPMNEFTRLSNKILNNSMEFVSVPPETWDKDTSQERRKMYIRCPTGYLIELKGYR